MSDYPTLSERRLRPAIWSHFTRAEDLFSQAHRMLMVEEPPSAPPAGVEGGPFAHRSSSSFRAPPPPLLPMQRGYRGVSPPPLLPMHPPFATPPVEAPSPPTVSPFCRRTATPPPPPPPPPPSALATPPSTPPLRVFTPPSSRSATPPSGCSSREEEEDERQIKKRVCGVCGDLARSLHFGGLACDSCKAFFRRAVLSRAFSDFACRREHHCAITVGSRRSCQACRFAGCLRAGMRVSLAKREDERTRLASHPSLETQRRPERPPSSVRSQELLYGSTFEETLHAGGVASLSPRLCSLATGVCSLPTGPCSLPTALCSLPTDQERLLLDPYSSLLVRDHDAVLGRTGGGASSSAPDRSHPSASGFVVRRYSPIGGHVEGLSSSHVSSALRRPTVSRSVAERLSPTRSHGSSPSSPLPQGSKRSRRSPPASTRTSSTSRRSPTTSTRSAPTSTRTLSTSTRTPSTSRRSPSTRSPIASWPGVQPGPPPEGRLCSFASCRPPRPTPDGELDSELDFGDRAEIGELLESYSSTFDAENLPVGGGGMIRSEDLGELYTCFIQSRARFLVSTPFYGSLARGDRLRLLHVAVAMSTYFTGAHLIDTRDYTWRSRRGKTSSSSSSSSSSPVMSASTVRQFLSHDQFVHLMRFYTAYSPPFSDLTAAVLMQVLSLFSPEEGLEDPVATERGRLHYTALLSRYLRVRHGHREAQELLETLLRSQREARQLVDLLQHVELTPQAAPKEEEEGGVDSHQILREGIRLVCDNARENLAKGVREREEPGPVSPEGQPRASPKYEERLDFIERILSSLADCEDPHILAEARRILPADLVRRFLLQLQCDSAPDA